MDGWVGGCTEWLCRGGVGKSGGGEGVGNVQMEECEWVGDMKVCTDIKAIKGRSVLRDG